MGRDSLETGSSQMVAKIRLDKDTLLISLHFQNTRIAREPTLSTPHKWRVFGGTVKGGLQRAVRTGSRNAMCKRKTPMSH